MNNRPNLQKLFLTTELYGIKGDYWVYGTDSGSPGNFHWCGNVQKFDSKEVKWAPGEPNPNFNCVYLKNMGRNASALATADCSENKTFICDVRKKGTDGMAMQQECLEIWGISKGKIHVWYIFWTNKTYIT